MSIADLFPTVAPWPGTDDGDEGRQQRGMAIAASTPIVKTAGGWTIPSQSNPGVYYHLSMDEDGAHCSCPDAFRTCKHIRALEIVLDREQKAKAVPVPVTATIDHLLPVSHRNGSVGIPVDPPAPPEEQTYWGMYNRTQTNERPLFKQLLYALCTAVPEPVRSGPGRPRIPLRDLIFGEVYREYSRLSSRRFQPPVKESAAEGYISTEYGHNSGTAFLNAPETTDLLRALITESARPLQRVERTFAPDSSGFSTEANGRWRDEKYGSVKTGASYVKTHIIVGVKTHIITSAIASVEPIGDITAFPALLRETRDAGFTVEEVVADGAYLSEKNLEWLNELGIESWIPFRKNSKFHSDNSLWDKHLATFLLNRERFAEHYHQRSQVETAFSMVKAKYGPSVRGKTPVSQANNVLCKLLANNLYVLVRSIYELGLEPEFSKIGARPNAVG